MYRRPILPSVNQKAPDRRRCRYGARATGIERRVSLRLALRHGDELVLTPESIALRVVDAHENVALYESETRRLSLQWEHEAEGRRTYCLPDGL